LQCKQVQQARPPRHPQSRPCKLDDPETLFQTSGKKDPLPQSRFPLLFRPLLRFFETHTTNICGACAGVCCEQGL